MFREIEKLRRLGFDAYDEDRMASAIELLRCHLTHFPDDGRAWFSYGDALRVIGLCGPAAVALGKAERSCPKEVQWSVQAHLGMVFQDKGDRITAERWYAKALESEEAQRTSWPWVLRGVNLRSMDRLDEAEECYRKAIAVNCEDEEAYHNLGCLLLVKGQYAAAKLAAESALRISPEYPEANGLLNRLEGAEDSRQLAEKLAK